MKLMCLGVLLVIAASVLFIGSSDASVISTCRKTMQEYTVSGARTNLFVKSGLTNDVNSSIDTKTYPFGQSIGHCLFKLGPKVDLD
ncbi:hypothetical protein K492DRAFT_177178 [Lichtheimia hyalospora FSU 10163]|nr:hypothetical protein K492DRAFT_177178 [Lichtheimia hyalospora FSU 10163]